MTPLCGTHLALSGRAGDNFVHQPVMLVTTTLTTLSATTIAFPDVECDNDGALHG
jgi:hypothetical protein